MISIKPHAFFGVEHFDHYEPLVDWQQRERLEGIEWLFRARDRRRLHDQLQVLDPDAVRAIFVIAGLVRQDHAALERGGAELGNAGRTLVHAQKAAPPVPGAMIEVESGLPQVLPRK